jgi:PAS domain S-box-containing protein
MSMPHVLQILHLEDDPHDTELAGVALKADGLQATIRRVDTRAAFETALLCDVFDVILADYNLPGFDGLTAQAIARRVCPQTPFIFLSGMLGEELAVDRLKEGATDYVLKHRMARLPSAVRRARRESDERADRRRAEDEVRRLNAELEQRVRQRTEELQAATTELARRDTRLQESEQWLRAILEYSPAAIYVKDVEGRYLLVNRQAERLLGRERGELLGKTDHEVMVPRLADMHRENDRRAISEQRALQIEEAALESEGIRVLASTKFPLYDAAGAVNAVCGISHDVTERKRADDQVRLARLEAERANLAKSDFISRMSHDLRTPLNAVLGFAQLLEIDRLTADQRDNVRQILSAGRHLLSLIDEVLDISRIEAGQLSMSPEPVSGLDVVIRAVDLVRPLAAQRGITIDVEGLPADDVALLADRQRLTQILLNLLSNAVKYNRPEGRVTMRFERVPPGRCRISVADTGAGIPASKLKLLFQPFERLGAEQTAVEGTGLGLALSRALAEAMSGTLGVTSVVDRGSTFWVELAIAEGQKEQPSIVSPAAATTTTAPVRARGFEQHTMINASKAGTVVYIEDNISNVRLMERVLRQRPRIELLHAPQGQEGLALVRGRTPDIVLLDMHLPDMSGEDVLRRLWEDPVSRRVPIVVLTADGTPGLNRRLRAAGATACLTKPLDINQVLQLMDELLASRAEGRPGEEGNAGNAGSPERHDA